ncbi:winged helix-turn-helix domain-containing protein [Mesorhizobium sp.]|uniref:winged helix-turn-helix domain-containing protein n=1 Tax=Mesorhizobium sp. TaxID=1871066 RepID=UPI0012226D75|nr:winged helix-turn-helix domain-containing protein [Mesorhizobium sp.]TIO07843.1 MAG: hypothetical protein E5X88_15480 [Mesorhizobium sp.]TIO37058.1 MAG: hypothetical protein E5X89_03465 [Mesorhizobium sp.]TIP14274.1 MAG: hypothetical protein E5X73_05140 [Mesorhizobium sp.]
MSRALADGSVEHPMSPFDSSSRRICPRADKGRQHDAHPLFDSLFAQSLGERIDLHFSGGRDTDGFGHRQQAAQGSSNVVVDWRAGPAAGQAGGIHLRRRQARTGEDHGQPATHVDLETRPLDRPAEEDRQGCGRFAGWELDMRMRRLTSPAGEATPLTAGEFNLLAAFLQSPQQILSREQLLAASRIHDEEVFDRSIDVQILRLRRKLEVNPSEPKLVVTERGAGYVFAASVEVL